MLSLEALYVPAINNNERGVMDEAVKFVLEKQLKNRRLWHECTQAFRDKEDADDEMWRGEFFGKLLRGASLTYKYSQDEELYSILKDAVEELLSIQDDDGRISTYGRDNEFCGWDTWCRKYVLTGLIHFIVICKDAGLKERALSACKGSLDYIISRIGEGENKKSITATSKWWGCVNSCSILEPTVAMCGLTGEQRYLDFAKYIISTGGSSECNFMELALAGEKLPYQYPIVKAYETMSYFEGLLAYYEITGEEIYFKAVKKFVRAVDISDLTIIGCCGCSFEYFDNSSIRQTEYNKEVMQETCVTVTWMRLMARLYAITGDVFYMDRIEHSGFNAMYGSINSKWLKQYNMFTKDFFGPFTFDSYSPLYKNRRGRGIGGFQQFRDGGYCGCCVAIGACGIALMPLTAVMQRGGEVALNMFFNGKSEVVDKNGKRVTLLLESDYPAAGSGKVKVKCDGECDITLKIRKPYWCKEMKVNGIPAREGYAKVADKFSDGDEIDVEFDIGLKCVRLNGKLAFTYGALTLAADEQKSDRPLGKAVAFEGELPEYSVLESRDGELIRIECKLKDGDKLLLTDYQSCGKKWLEEKSDISVWMDTI